MPKVKKQAAHVVPYAEELMQYSKIVSELLNLFGLQLIKRLELQRARGILTLSTEPIDPKRAEWNKLAAAWRAETADVLRTARDKQKSFCDRLMTIRATLAPSAYSVVTKQIQKNNRRYARSDLKLRRARLEDL